MKLFFEFRNIVLFCLIKLIAVQAIAENQCSISLDFKKNCPLIHFTLAAAGGGGSHVVAQGVSNWLSKNGIPSVVENMPSGNGVRATDSVKQAKSPCRFLISSNSNISLNELWVKSSMSSKVSKDFEPVSLLTKSPFVLAVRVGTNQKGSFKSVSQFMSGSREGVFYLSAGTGSMGHLLGHMMSESLNSKDQHVPGAGSSGASMTFQSQDDASIFWESPTTVASAFLISANRIAKGVQDVDRIEILGSTAEKEIKVSAKDEQGKKQPVIIPPLSARYPKLSNLKSSPYIGVFQAKPEGADAQTKKKFNDVRQTVECLLGSALKEEKFRADLISRGFETSSGTALELTETLKEYVPGGYWDSVMKRVRATESAASKGDAPPAAGR